MKKFLKKHLLTIVIVLIFIVGLAILLYPTVSEYFNSRHQTRVISSYHEAVSRMDAGYIEELLAQAREYNVNLRTKPDRFTFTDEDYAEYFNLLNIHQTGYVSVIATLEVGLVNIALPIYHGTGEGVLQIALGHLEGTSLPVGGLGTHTVITGHRGLPSAMLLTEIDRLADGDIFMIHVLNETLTYQVDQIVIVEPDDFSTLDIDLGKDYATLLTCTPYGINSHRLLVRGHRIENEETPIERRLVLMNEAARLGEGMVVLGVLIPVMTLLIIVKLITFIRKSR